MSGYSHLIDLDGSKLQPETPHSKTYTIHTCTQTQKKLHCSQIPNWIVKKKRDIYPRNHFSQRQPFFCMRPNLSTGLAEPGLFIRRDFAEPQCSPIHPPSTLRNWVFSYTPPNTHNRYFYFFHPLPVLRALLFYPTPLVPLTPIFCSYLSCSLN